MARPASKVSSSLRERIPVFNNRGPTGFRRCVLFGIWLLVTFGPVATWADTRTWTGSVSGDGSWSNPVNWGGVAPASLDALFFAGTNQLAATNDFAVTNTYDSINFNAGSGPFVLSGTPMVLNNGITNNSTSTQSNNFDLQVANMGIYVTNGGTLVLNGTIASTPGTLTNGIGKPSVLTKAGSGVLIMRGPVTATAPLSVQGGTLYVDGALSGPSSVMVYSGATLGGHGSLSGDVSIQDGGTLAPGTNDARGPATLTLSNLTLNANSIVRMNLNAPGISGGTNDLIVVHGDLTLNGILQVSGLGTNGVYPIIRYDGALTDNGMVLGPGVSGTLLVDATNKIISLAAAAFSPAPTAPMRVYFVGSSMLYTYNVPDTVWNMAVAAGDAVTYNCVMVGGASLSFFDTNGSTLAWIDAHVFDVVLLQESTARPSIPSERDNLMYPAARDLNAHITSHGQKTVFFETWGWPTGDSDHCALYDTPPQYHGCGSTNMLIAVRMAYARLANELGATISPVGLAWLTIQTERPDLNLYLHPSQFGDPHANPLGAYLASCVLYATFLGRSPVGNSFLPAGVTNAELAAYVQGVAERTVFQDPWAVDQFGFGSNGYYWASDWTDYTNRTSSRLSGVLISGTGGLPSPSVKLDTPVSPATNVYLGVFDDNYLSAGQGRLYISSGGSLLITSNVVVGKEGQGWVQQNGGTLQVNGVLSLAEQPSANGSYNLADGLLSASGIASGLGKATFNVTGGRLSFLEFGSALNPFSLVQAGGTLLPSNTATIYGDFSLGNAGTLALVLGELTNSLNLVGGTASLSGTLSLSNAPGFTLTVGRQFTLLTADAISGRFSKVTVPSALSHDTALVLAYTSNSIIATTVDGLADSNTNGLPDWWELQWFGTLDCGQTWDSSFSGDGIPNGVKYALYADPTVALSPGLMPQGGISNGYFSVSYRQHTGGTGLVGVDYTADGLTYRVEVAGGLQPGAWSSGTNYVEWTGTRADNADGTETVMVRLKTPAALSPDKFLRLVIERTSAALPAGSSQSKPVVRATAWTSAFRLAR